MSDSPFQLDKQYLETLLPMIDIGTWAWDLRTNAVVYSVAWGQLLGYSPEELLPVVETWERMVLPEDLPNANEQISLHLTGKKDFYEAEFRMVCKDGHIIWAQDKGKVISYDEAGNPLKFLGVLQSVTRLKEAELLLLDKQTTLDLAVNVAGLGTWDWDIPGNYIKYNDEYLSMLDYAQSDMTGSIEEWIDLNHPEDLKLSSKLLDAYLSGETDFYECEIRMRHRKGHYIWTRDVGQIVARDSQGRPTRLIGGHLNIDALKRSQAQLTEALGTLENSRLYLEQEVKERTKELMDHDQMLWTVNQVSRKLLSFQPHQNFDDLVRDCLRLLGESVNKNRVYIWKDHTGHDGIAYCTQIYEWVRGVFSIQGDLSYEDIPYLELPNFKKSMDGDICLNSIVRDLAESERMLLEPQGVKSILIAPVSINGTRWGFIGVDNCESECCFSNVAENLLFMSGSMLANTIAKMDKEVEMREIEERTQLSLNAMPLCYNLWTQNFENIRCNDEAVRVFGTGTQSAYLDHFFDLSPDNQPCGKNSIEMALDYLRQAFEVGYCRFNWLHQRLDGTPIPAEITLVRLKYRSGFLVAGYTRDLRTQQAMLDELRAKEDALRSARDEALQSSKAKSNFLANMSHEIRTPMNAISGLTEIILRENPHGKAAEHAWNIRNACNNLLNLINDILDISKIESGKLEILPAEYELASLLNDVITICRMRLGSRPLMFLTNIDSHLPAHLIGDETRIKQILINLLSNAIKFTDSGHIALRVDGQLEGNQFMLRFTVTDTGSGIQQEDIHRLFAEFERVNTTKNRSVEGTGLGLAISKQLCEMMGGHIEVSSSYGVGSVFTATIPQRCTADERMISHVEEKKTLLLYEPRNLYRKSISESLENLDCRCIACANQSELYENIQLMPYDYILTASLHLSKVQSLVQRYNLHAQIAAFADYGQTLSDDSVYTIFFPVNCLQLSAMLTGQRSDSIYSPRQPTASNFIAPTARVLVVDDNAVNLSVAAGLMAPYQFSIDTAENGLEAIEKVRKTRYDLVFMDHMMPVMDGIDATIAIRQIPDPYFQSLPIIALTANALIGTREMFIREGMNDFLAKPIELNKLSSVLLKWLPAAKVIKQAPEQLPAPTQTSLTASIPGVDTAQGLLSMGGNMDHYLHILSVYYLDGTEKRQSLVQHLKEKNLAAFRIEVHALKSASASIGAMPLSTMAAQLELAAQEENFTYINSNFDEFLSTLDVVLTALHHLSKSQETAHQSAHRQANCSSGNLVELKTQLYQLKEAASLASIGKIDTIMVTLNSFAWPEGIVQNLAEIQSCLALFDYDGILDCVNHLEDILS